MGLLMNSNDEIKNKVISEFGEKDNYIIVKKYNKPLNSLLKLLIYRFGWLLDSNREFILYLSPKGIYEKEISNTLKGNFSLIPWSEIDGFEVEDKGNKAIIYVNHLGRNYNYEVMFDKTKFLKGNRDRFLELVASNFSRVN